MDHAHLSGGPGRTLADVGHTEAEAVGAAQRVALPEVVEARFTQVAVGSHHVHLMSSRSAGEPQVCDTGPARAAEVCVHLAGAGSAGVRVGAASSVTLTANTLREISVSERTGVTPFTCEPLLTHTLTCTHAAGTRPVKARHKSTHTHTHAGTQVHSFVYRDASPPWSTQVTLIPSGHSYRQHTEGLNRERPTQTQHTNSSTGVSLQV